MTRVYERQQVLWRLPDLQAMEADGKAQLLVDHGIWIVQLPEGGKVAVRPDQILVAPAEDYQPEPDYAAEQWAENAWLRAAEDGGDEYRAFEDYERSCGKIDQDQAAAIARAQDLAAERARHADLLAEFGVT